MTKKITLQSKLNLFMLSIILLIVVVGCFIAVKIFFSIYEEDIENQVSRGIQAFEQVVIVDNQTELAAVATGVAELSTHVLLTDNPEFQTILNEYFDHINTQNLNYVRIMDTNTVRYEKINGDPTIFSQAAEHLQTHDPKPECWLEGDSEHGLYMFCYRSLYNSDGSALGSVLIGLKLSTQKAVDFMQDTASLEATIFGDNKRLVTTITIDDINQAGTVLDPSVAAIVLDEGKDFIGKAKILGETYLVAYKPIVDMDNQTVGALFVGRSMASMYVVRNHLIFSITLLGVLLLLGSYWFSNRWLKGNITNPIRWVAEAMKKVAAGDYDAASEMPPAQNEEIEMLQSSLHSMVIDIVAHKEKLETAAYIDAITGLKNRVILYDTYHDVEIQDRNKLLSVLFYLDVDNLKYINNLFGHRFGDALLIQIGEDLSRIVKDKEDYEVYRISGDEFAICKVGKFDIPEITRFSQLILSVFDNAFTIGEQNLNITVSIGVSYNEYCEGTACKICTRECKDNLEKLLKKAELAMNEVKAKGKNGYMLFDPSMNEVVQRRAYLEQDLKRALRNGELELYYQPKFNLEQNTYDGFEALIRWNHEKLGFIPPLEFIKIAEESTLILDLGIWILEKSCRFIQDYNQKNHTSYCIAVNVSPLQLLNEGFEDKVLDIIEETGLHPDYLELEITESVLINSLDFATQKLNFLKNKGISIALDDFGTGYSSLTYLKTLPITTVKLDKTFVDDIATNPLAFKIVDNVIQIARNIGLNIVVEGIETAEQLSALKRLGCHKIQGYYFSKPVPESELTKVLKRKKC
jgi:diguanylate cyclase (GGDEF)-like protein